MEGIGSVARVYGNTAEGKLPCCLEGSTGARNPGPAWSFGLPSHSAATSQAATSTSKMEVAAGEGKAPLADMGACSLPLLLLPFLPLAEWRLEEVLGPLLLWLFVPVVEGPEANWSTLQWEGKAAWAGRLAPCIKKRRRSEAVLACVCMYIVEA